VKRGRFYLAALALGLTSFYAGRHLVTTRHAPPVHQLTGRQIAGIATDAAWLDRLSRQKEESPDRALELIGVRAGMVVADVGAGTGYMTIRLAKLVGPGGRVYATDIQPAMLRSIRDKVQNEHLENVTVVQGSDVDAHLPEGTVDLAVLVDVYHELERPREILGSLRRSLKPDGELVLIEYRKEDPGLPIAPTHRMSVAEVRMEVEAEGFRFDRLISELPRQHIFLFNGVR
jgi:ubiquinone/menaquinone biosynthesis C-methylase UbiE